MTVRFLSFSAGALMTVGAASALAGPCTDDVEHVSRTIAATDAGAGPTKGAHTTEQASPTRPTQQHPPTAIIGQETTGRATSPQDVQRQTAGEPTAGEEAGGAQPRRDRGTAMALFARARALDAQGDTSGCMQALREAKQELGID